MRHLVWLAGVDEATLERCPPSERMKLSALGATVLAIACVAAVSGTFLAREFLHTTLITALVLGTCWGAVILTIDRWMIVSIRRQHSVKATVALASTRIVLALAIGLVTAPPLLLKAFQPEITAQATQERQARLRSGQRSLAARFSDIPQLEAHAQALTVRVGSSEKGAALTSSPAYVQAVKRVSKLRSEAASAQSRAVCEFDGTCGTHHVGEGPAYRVKNRVATKLADEAKTAERQLEQVRGGILAEESSSLGLRKSHDRSELAYTESKLHAQRTELSSQETALTRAYHQPLGLADRLDALEMLAGSRPTVGWWNAVLAIIIILLDTSPAVGKLVMVLGKNPTPYELEVERDERLHSKINGFYAQAALEKAEIESRFDLDDAELVRQVRPAYTEPFARDQAKTEVAEKRRWLKARQAHIRRQVDDQIMRDFGEPATSRQTATSDNSRPAWAREPSRRRFWQRRGD